MTATNNLLDYNLRRFLSPIATRACEIVDRIRDTEQKELWSKGLNGNGDAHQTDEILYPGVMFHLAKGRMEKTDLWKIVENMPKGSLLHAHMDAMFDIDFLIGQIFSTPGIHIYAEKPMLTPKDCEEAPFLFQYSTRPIQESEDKPTMWSQAYEPSSMINLQKAASSFPNGGEAGFKAWLRSRCVLSPEHSYLHHHGVDAIWTIFMRTFPIIGSMVNYEPIRRRCLNRLFSDLAADGIKYVEFRVAFVFQYFMENSDTPVEGYNEFCRLFMEELEKFKSTEEGSQFYGARIIWTTDRLLPNRGIAESMKECIEAKKAYPELICGFDLVNQEDLGRPLVDLTPVLLWFRKRCVEEGVEIPFMFHAGECLGDGDETDHNLFDAILLGTRRIGHGFSLYKHPLLIDLVKEKKILIECCPISNEILRLTNSIKSHPLPALLSRGVPVSLCNDDPAILGHGKNGLTHDFWQAVQGLENMGLSGLAAMVENSIRWSCYEDKSSREWQADLRVGVLDDGIKAARLREWFKDFENFCQWIVLEFEDDTDD